jgi:predicted DNA-binding mobile mystery protein A
MKNKKRRMLLDQASEKLMVFEPSLQVPDQPLGWIHTIRTALGMSLSQLGARVGMTAQGIKAVEQRERSRSVTLQSLHEIATALDMQLVYAIVPKKGTLKQVVDEKAEQKAKEIIRRTHTTMLLENQQLKKEKLMKAVMEKKEELKNEMPKLLWD